MPAAARSASSGATREAETAGESTATTEITTASSTVPSAGSTGRPGPWMWAPNARATTGTSQPTPSAASTPVTPVTKPVRAPSAASARNVAPRPAPTARSSASCRIRWAKTIRNVLAAIRPAAATAIATNIPTTAKTWSTWSAAPRASASRTSAPVATSGRSSCFVPANNAVILSWTGPVAVPPSTSTSICST